MSVVEAIQTMQPGLQRIREILAETGQKATGPLAELLGFEKIVQANQGLFELLSGVDDMLVGLANSGLLTQERFSALAGTINQAFASLTAQGVAGATALELMQPQLQKLWELQQQFGFQVDASTQKLLTQAEQQGLVGQHMKDVQTQMLDVLKAIAQVLGAEIPGAMAALPGVAQNAAQGVTNSFLGVRDAALGIVNSIPKNIPINVTIRPGFAGGTGMSTEEAGDIFNRTRIPALAAGGVVTRPTLSLIGEAGPEAVVPLDEFQSGMTLNIGPVYGSVDDDFAEKLADRVGLGGRVKTKWVGALR